MDPERLSKIEYVLDAEYETFGDRDERRRRAGLELLAAARSARKLARAVLLYHQGNAWTDSDTAEWRELTGQEDVLMRLAAGPADLRKMAYEVTR